MRVLLLLFTIAVTFASSQCPRRQKSEEEDHSRHQPPATGHSEKKQTESPDSTAPSSAPPEKFIQTTFLHNDKSDDDKIFSEEVKEVFAEVRQRLNTHLRLTVDNEDVDCTTRDHPRCTEYTLRSPFHLIVIEDPSTGAEVYSIKRKFNKNKAVIEASILDAFSQHSGQDMTIYASESAEKEVGFVRRLSNEEVLAMLAKRIKTKRTIISRSPLETNLIEMSLLEFRSFAEKENWRKLDEFDETTLNTAMNRQQLSFILFWTNVNSISQHAFWLWSKASEILKPRYADISFGALACHKRPQLCDANQLSKTDDFHTVFAYRNGKRYTSLKDMKDINYYVQWVTMLMSGTAIELKTENDLKEARKGKIASFDELRPAITIGIFDSTSTKHFKMFMEICEIFIGRYHFVYFIKKGSTDRIFTVRPYEKKKRVDFDESFDAESLAQFVTQSSFPSIVDITRGFTSDILLRQPRPVVVLLHSSANEISSFVDFCSTKSRHICTHIIRDRCDILDDMLNQISLDKSDSPKIIVFVKDKIYVSEYEKYKNAKELKEAIEVVVRTDPIKIIAENDVHPLRYLQLAHVNEVFGAQQITLLPDPQIVDTYFHHDIEDMDDIGDSYGGCPVMSRLHRMKDHIKDEL